MVAGILGYWMRGQGPYAVALETKETLKLLANVFHSVEEGGYGFDLVLLLAHNFLGGPWMG